MATSWLEINLSRLDANVAAIRQAISPSGAKLCTVVKADAYGLGASQIARRLALKGVDMFAVFSPEQAEDLVAMSLRKPILVLMQVHELDRKAMLYEAAAEGRLHLSIHDRMQVYDLDRVSLPNDRRLPVHIYLDTGMSRGGVAPEEFPDIVHDIVHSRSLRLAGVYTHLASTQDDLAMSETQATIFDQVLTQTRLMMPLDVVTHMASTTATFSDPRYHRDMVRVGVGLYGYGSDEVKPIARWVSSVIHMRRHPTGTPVGYNSTHRLARNSILGLVPAGYADGYPLAMSNAAVVDLPEHSSAGRPRSVPVLGRVNMDQIVIDLTDVPGARLGTRVELISDNPDSPCALPRLAELARSSCYELLTRLSLRLTRKYVSVEVPPVTPVAPRVPSTRMA